MKKNTKKILNCIQYFKNIVFLQTEIDMEIIKNKFNKP